MEAGGGELLTQVQEFNHAQSRPSPSRTPITCSQTFADYAPGNRKLFAVQSGVPVREALEYAASLLDTSLSNAHEVAQEEGDNKAWITVYLLESALAVVNAAIGGLRDEERNQ
ncbi:DUF3077 domain-containing protein [Azotobacter chroococcum]